MAKRFKTNEVCMTQQTSLPILDFQFNERITVNATLDHNPPPDEPVLVESASYECLGYLDQNGKWRNWYSDKEIEGVIRWNALEERFRLVI